MSRSFGFDLLSEQAADIVAADVAALEGYWPFGDTPIEKLFSASLFTYLRIGLHELKNDAYFCTKQEFVDSLLESEQRAGQMVVQTQAQLPDWRVDFLIYCYADWPRFETYRPHGWRKLIVECDGHDFHERTKEQAAKDRARDREAQASGYEIFRFTGSELWKDPMGCVKQVIAWGDKGV